MVNTSSAPAVLQNLEAEDICGSKPPDSGFICIVPLLYYRFLKTTLG